MKFIDRLVGWFARVGVVIAAVATLVSMFLIAYSVVMRYFFNNPISWIDEIVGYLLVAAVMLAAADALREGEHISVDIVTERLGKSGRWVTELVGLLAVAVSAALLLIEGYDMVEFSHSVGLLSNGTLAVPMWIPESVVPIGSAMLVVAALVRFVVLLRHRDDADEEKTLPARGIE